MAKTDDIPDQGLTIEELSFRCGVTTRNIRAYQSRGLIPPPDTRPGERTGYYNQAHAARLRLINRLQERGFSLAGIADLLNAWEDGRSLDQVLGMESAVAEGRTDDSIVISEEELKQLTPPELENAEEIIQRLRALGILVHEGNRYRLRHPRILQMGLNAASAGIPLEQLLAEFERVQKDAHRIARRFVKLYDAFVWKPYMEAGMPREQLTDLVERMKRMRQLAVEITQPMMAEALSDEIEAMAEQNLPTPETLAEELKPRS